MLKKMLMALALTVALAGTALAEGEKYVNGIDANFPPFAYVDKDGKPDGFDVKSMDWIANKMGFTVEHKPMDWDTIIPSLNTNKIDMVCSGMSITEARAEQVNFSDPYWVMKPAVSVRADSDLTMDQVHKGKIKFGIQRGTSEADWLENNKEPNGWNMEIVYYDTQPLAIEDLLNGRIDAVGTDEAPAKEAIAHGKEIKIIGTFAEVTKYGVAVRKADTKLLEAINEGYKLLMADPYWKELQDEYFNKPAE